MKKLKNILTGQFEALYRLSGNEIIRARVIENKVKRTNRKMIDKGMSYKMRLSAMIWCDTRPGQLWAI